MRAWILTGVLLVLAFANCTNADNPHGEACYPGDYIYCACDDGVQGYAHCPPSGEGYQPCDCSGIHPAQPVDAGTIVCVPDDAGKLPTLCPCTGDNSECESNDCFFFPAKGSHCTKSCRTGADCPPASGGCNMKGVCMVP